MVSALLLRLSVVLLLIGMGLGILMGIKQDFTLAPAHAHLNLVGGVVMFLMGLYYRLVPSANGAFAMVQAALLVIGAIVLPIGIGIVRYDHSKEIIPIIGSLFVFASMAMFVIVVMRTARQ